MYAVIRTGGKQYRVQPDDVIEIEKIPGEAGDVVTFEEVLMLGGEGEPRVGDPLLSGVSVAAEILAQKRARKIIVFKKKRRKNYRRKKGHRQHLTAVRITEILTDGKRPAKSADAGKTKTKAAAKKAEKTAEPLFTPPEGEADDLKRISGVGPVLEKKLHDFGVKTFAQVAAFTKEDIAKLDEALNFKGRIERDDWVGQAKKLAEEKSKKED